MRSVNKVILIGNLTRDPEMRQTPSGQNVVTFGLATNREWVTKDGRRQNSAEYHDLVAWARLADICQQYLRKGKLVYVEGYLKTRNWDTPEGVKKFRTEIVVQDMIMLDKRKEGEEAEYIPEGNSQHEESAEEHRAEAGEAAPSEEAEKEIRKTVIAESAADAEEREKEPVAVGGEEKGEKKIDIDSDLGL